MNARLRISVFAALATLLGSLSLVPLFESFAWLPPVMLVIAVVTTTSALVHRVRFLAVAAPLVMLLALAGALTLLYAHQHAPLGFIPGPGALQSLRTTLSSGFDDTSQLAAPAEVTRGLSLMTVGGIGVVAVAVETLATSLRRPAVAGLPLLAIFTVPAAILSKGVGWIPFVAAAAGYLCLLLAEGRDRVARWGRAVRGNSKLAATQPGLDGHAAAAPGRPTLRPVSSPASGRPARAARSRGRQVTAPLTQVGRRVGATAVGVAVLVPAAIPGLHAGWFGTHHTNGAGGIGTGSGTTVSPIVSFVRTPLDESTPQPLFSYRTTGTPTYLHMLTLTNFNGVEWTQPPIGSSDDTKVSKGIPAPDGVTVKPAGTAKVQVSVSGLKEPYLPVPLMPAKISAHGNWVFSPATAIVYSRHSSTVHLNYDVTQAVYQPSPTFLNGVREDPNSQIYATYAQLPDDLPPELAAVADQVVSNAQATTPYEDAVALETWFRTHFQYDLSVNAGSDGNAILSFLSDRRGYCEQFAATMALMARAEHIPARVDIGFTPGTKQADGSYLVTSADAHAWPELYFPGAGWLRFEPTPRPDATAPSYTTGTPAQPVNPSTAAAPPGSHGANANQLPTDPAGNAPKGGKPLKITGSTPFSAAHGHIPWGWIAVFVFVVMLGCIAPGVRASARRRRQRSAITPAARAHAAWAELGDDLRDLGLEWRGETDTPRRAAAGLLAAPYLRYDQAGRNALERLARAEEIARYAGGRRLDDRLAGFDPRADELVVRAALRAATTRVRRLRARLAPASTGRAFADAAAALRQGLTNGRERIAAALIPGWLRRNTAIAE